MVEPSGWVRWEQILREMQKIISPLLLGVHLARAHGLHSGSWWSGSHLAFAQFSPWEEQRAALLPALHACSWWQSWREGAGSALLLLLLWSGPVSGTGKQLCPVLCPAFILGQNKQGCTKLCNNSNASTLWLHLGLSRGFRGTDLMCILRPNSVVFKSKDCDFVLAGVSWTENENRGWLLLLLR